jgi:hypothetical protein
MKENKELDSFTNPKQDMGYQPDGHNKLDVNNHPKGGSGIPNKELQERHLPIAIPVFKPTDKDIRLKAIDYLMRFTNLDEEMYDFAVTDFKAGYKQALQDMKENQK